MTAHATKAPKVPGTAVLLRRLLAIDSRRNRLAIEVGGRAADAAGLMRGACGIGVAWLLGLPRRAGRRLHATDDTEARWWAWEVTEGCGGLVRWYRDTRFTALPYDPALRRDELRDLAVPGRAAPDRSCAWDQ